jgi:uncharacterized protein YegL
MSNLATLNSLANDLGFDIDDLTSDPFIGNTLAQQSNLPNHIGQIVAADNLTTDRVVGVAKVGDSSGSMLGEETEEAFVQGWNGVDDVLAKTSQRGEFFMYGSLYSSDYPGNVRELHTFTRLVSPKDNRTLNVPPLTRAQYGTYGATPTVAALQKASADMALFERASGADEVDADFSPVISLLTDGFMNVGPKAQAWREFIQAPARRERWQVFAVCFADTRQVESFYEHLRRSSNWDKFTQYVPLSGEDSESKAAARLLFEGTMTGWGFYVSDLAKIDTIKNSESLLRAQLYNFVEGYIVANVEGSYNGKGGLSIPPANVLTAWHEPEEIYKVLQVKLSSSLVRASQALGKGGVLPVANVAPDDSVV